MLSPKSYSAKSQFLKHGEEKSGKNNRAEVVKNNKLLFLSVF